MHPVFDRLRLRDQLEQDPRPGAAGELVRMPDRRAGAPDQRAVAGDRLLVCGVARRDHLADESFVGRLHTQPSVSAHQSASTCGSAESTAIWKSKGIAVVSFRSVQVSERGDLRPAAIGADFTVLAPPELISYVRDVAGRLHGWPRGRPKPR